MSDFSEDRLRQAIARLMAVPPPSLDRRTPHLARWPRSLAAGAATFVLLFGLFAVAIHFRGTGGAPALPPPVGVKPSSSAVGTLPATPSSSPTPQIGFLPPAGPPCTAADLAGRAGQQTGAGGSGVSYLILTDTGSAPCTLTGTPPIQFLDSVGRRLAVPTIQYAASGMFPLYANHGVGLLPRKDEGPAPGALPEGGTRGQASLPMQYTDQCSSSIATVRILLPGGSLTIPMAISGPLPPCQSITVNPYQPAEYLPPG